MSSNAADKADTFVAHLIIDVRTFQIVREEYDDKPKAARRRDASYPVRRLLTEIIKLETVPRHVRFSIAYVCPPAATGNWHEYIYYGTVTSDDKVLVPSFFHKVVDAAKGVASEVGELFVEAEKDVPQWCGRAGLLRHDLSLASRGHDKSQLVALDTITLHRYHLGEFSCALPVGKMPDSDIEVAAGFDTLVLPGGWGQDWEFIESKVAVHQLKALNRIVRTRKKGVVLLSGPPGSGKDVFANAIHYGSMREKRLVLKDLSVGGLAAEEIQRRLFGGATAGGPAAIGLIGEAAMGSLFLDEFDKVKESDARDFYASLLRVFETQTYYPVGSIEPRLVGDVNWILAGAFSTKKSRELMPPDLFSRLSDSLELKAPQSELSYVRGLFLRWAFEEVMSWTGRKTARVFASKTPDRVDRIARIMLGWKPENPKEYQQACDPGPEIKEVADQFIEVIRDAPRSPARIGIRAIRQASLAVTRRLLEHALTLENKKLTSIWTHWRGNEEDLRDETSRIASDILLLACGVE